MVKISTKDINIIFFLFQAKLQQLVLLRIPDVVTIARCPESGEQTEL